jgi:hypothetical protein
VPISSSLACVLESFFSEPDLRRHQSLGGAGCQQKNGVALDRLPATGDKIIDWPAFGSAFSFWPSCECSRLCGLIAGAEARNVSRSKRSNTSAGGAGLSFWPMPRRPQEPSVLCPHYDVVPTQVQGTCHVAASQTHQRSKSLALSVEGNALDRGKSRGSESQGHHEGRGRRLR